MAAPDFGGVNPLARASVAGAVEALGHPRQQAFQRALAGQLGQSMQGQVLGRLTDGSFVVRVDGLAARMQLPAGTALGADVALKLVALEPRPTFEVPGGALAFAEAMPAGAAAAYLSGPAANKAAQVAASSALPAVLAMPAEPGQDGAPATLSPTARLLGSVLATALQAGPAQAAAVSRTPLAPAPTLDAAQLAKALRDGVATSGLFYESHVAEWAQGQRTLAALAQEPQMATPRPGQPERDPATAQFISQQLATQEQARIAWQGQLWPGQPLELALQRQVERDAPDGRHDGAPEPDDAWQGSLRLRFAGLGELAASLTLAGGQLHIRLDTGGEPAGARLRARAPELAAALAAAGTPLGSLAIRDPGPGDD
jgi:hypothetical protein